MRPIQLLALLAAAASAGAVGQASLAAPGGLDRSRTPQFILLTHDDSVDQSAFDLLRSVTNGRAANGCPLTATLFTMVDGTDCEVLQMLWRGGYEVADHTTNHKHLTELDQAGIKEQLAGGRQGLADCGIPIQSIVGARAPYLETKPEVRAVLKNNGFLYDSTLIEEGTGNSLSRGMGARVWPWDMANGIPINCGWFAPSQRCDSGESYPGLWEVPVWDLDALGSYSMDYGDNNAYPVFDILKANFDAAFGGNRAPLPIYIHSPWLRQDDHLSDLKKFADYASSKPNVYFVTMRQLIAWMKNPIPAGQLTPAKLGCRNPGGAPATPEQLASGGQIAGGAPGKPPPVKRAPPRPTPRVPVPKPVPGPAPVPAGGARPALPATAGPASVPTATPPVRSSPPPAPSPPLPVPAMPPSGVRIIMTVGGESEGMFARVTQPQLLVVLRNLLAEAYTSPVFLASVAPVPAGGMRRRRALLQQEQWLRAVAVVGGSQPLQMYSKTYAALRNGTISRVLALSGGYVAAASKVVPFQDGRDIVPPLSPPPAAVASALQAGEVPVSRIAQAPSPAATPPPSGSDDGDGVSVGLMIGIAVGSAAAVVLAAGLIYWLVVRRRQRAAAIADGRAASCTKSGQASSSFSDTSSQGSAPELDVSQRRANEQRFSNAVFEEAA